MNELAEFATYHAPVLSSDEVRHGLILNALARAPAEGPTDLQFWTLGAPGQCAIKRGPHSILLGALEKDQCRGLAELTASTDYPGAAGAEDTAISFAERAMQLGLPFEEPEPQQLHRLSDKPRYPGAGGHARVLTSKDLPLFADWLARFYREAVPHDIPPSPTEIARMAETEQFLLWIDGGEPVSMAGIVRRLKKSAAISGVYTPPERRGRGYAGSVTAANVDRIYREGYTIACLYTDLRNPISNRCYRNIGFRSVCRWTHVRRRARDPIQPAS
jgi:RimJ/RimL family protein N-acetyltransferase